MINFKIKCVDITAYSNRESSGFPKPVINNGIVEKIVIIFLIILVH